MKQGEEPVPCRLSVILAREAPVGVIFRRGPSKLVELIRWRTDTDTFERGQWFKGRIYEHRSDLSPDGSLLVYFASKYGQRSARDSRVGESWTAISKPPWLTALTLWPMRSPVDWGGGMFQDEETLLLCHPPGGPRKFQSPPKLRVIYDVDQRTEPHIYLQRLTRDGWIVRHRSSEQRPLWKGHSSLEIREKENPRPSLILVMRLLAPFEPGSGTSWAEYEVEDRPRGPTVSLDGAVWADWDQQRRLVFTRQGRLIAGKIDSERRLIEHELADFNADSFEAKEAPAWAQEW